MKMKRNYISPSSLFWFNLFITLYLFIIIPTSQSFNDTLEIVAKFNIIEFDLGNGTIEKCSNCIPAGIKLSSNGTIFVSFPRWYPDVLVTFAKFNPKTNFFEPFPSLEFNQLYLNSDPSGLNSILGFEIDLYDNLLLLDQGKINNNPAAPKSIKLMNFTMNGNLKKTFLFPNEIADEYSSFLNDIVIDQQRQKAYITDSGVPIDPEKYEFLPGIIVLDLIKDEKTKILTNHNSVFPDKSFWLHIDGKPVNKNQPMMTGADGIALSCDGEVLFYCPLSSRMIYSILRKDIEDAIENGDDSKITVYEGFKKEASDGLLASSKGNLYMTGIETGSIYVANEIDKDLLRFNYNDFEGLEGSEFTMWPDTLSIHQGFLYFISNQLNNFPQNINYTHPKNGEYNFAIFRFNIQNDDSYLNLSQCTGFSNKWGVGSIIIWVCFAVIILIVLSFVLMGSNNQEEVIDKHMNLGVVKED